MIGCASYDRLGYPPNWVTKSCDCSDWSPCWIGFAIASNPEMIAYRRMSCILLPATVALRLFGTETIEILLSLCFPNGQIGCVVANIINLAFTVVFALGDITSTICEFWFPSTLNVTVVVTVKLFVNCPSVGVVSVGLVGVVGLAHRGGGAGGILNGPKFNVLGGVGRIRPLLSLLLLILLQLSPPFRLPPTNEEIFSTSIDFRFCALNVLVLPKMPIRPVSIGDIVSTTLSADSGLSICCPVLVKLLRLDVVSDGVPAWLNTPCGVVGLNTVPIVV